MINGVSEEVREEIRSVLRDLRAIVDEFGDDYVYDLGTDISCKYERNGKPSCIIGQLLFRRGKSVEFLAQLDDHCGAINKARTEIRNELGIVHDETINVLQMAQSGQDREKPWGECLFWANMYANLQYGSDIML